MDLARDVLEPSAVMILEASVWRRLRAVGVTRAGRSLIVAMADPTDRLAITELEVRTGLRVVAAQADERLILEALERSYDLG